MVTATPLVMPSRRPAPAIEVVYTTTTGDKPRPAPVYVPEPHCFVCGRHTDHVGEHDDLVDAGHATYDHHGQVRLTDAGRNARDTARAEYAAYLNEIDGL